MNSGVLAGLTLIPAIPGAVRFVRAMRSRSKHLSRSIVVWGALTMVAGVVMYGGTALSVFPEVARAAPEDRANVMSIGLAHGAPALWTGLLAGALLCVLGGVTR